MYENIGEYRRTAVIKLDTPEGADKHLRETIEQFKYCSNTASEWCWHGDDGYHVTSKAKAEDALYDQLREDTELTANLVQKGIHQAVEAIKSGVERLKNDQDTSRPTFTADTAVYATLKPLSRRKSSTRPVWFPWSSMAPSSTVPPQANFDLRSDERLLMSTSFGSNPSMIVTSFP
jgi:hypothetical protein